MPDRDPLGPEQLLEPFDAEAMGYAGRVLSEAIQIAIERACPGRTTRELDHVIEQVLIAGDVEPVFRDETFSNGYPACSCLSINEQVAHGVPGETELRTGDLLTIDAGGRFRGWCVDMAWTVQVGQPSEDEHLTGNGKQTQSVRRAGEVRDRMTEQHRPDLLRCGEQLIDTLLDRIAPGRWWSEVMNGIGEMVATTGFSLVTELTGHGIGRRLHQSPVVPSVLPMGSENHRSPSDFQLVPGLAIAIEPILVAGEPTLCRLSGPHTFETIDGSDAVHFELTVGIGEEEVICLTPRPRVDHR